ncbi:hypothetical protein MBRA1_002900 [Malassezia brasiliensis]|uniref:Uncharacterized protein n=1 Tax=Malassezia brasiliensis TaxID=1821822 RepID=A0AAF0DUZ7_9BASI|nr:hypothetical protein MBRA1_002900 [Malassezia brasiliensis]
MSHDSGGAAPPAYTDAPQSSYTRATRAQSDDVFEIAPRPDAASFQAGYLGLDTAPARIVGDVLVKLARESQQATQYSECIVSLRAVEHIYGVDAQHMELYAAQQSVWRAAQLPAHVPAVLPFEFELTPDLPQCIHGQSSDLLYVLEAHLVHANGARLVACTVVHPTRYTSPGWSALAPYTSPGLGERDLAHWNVVTPNSRYSLSPLYWHTDAPIGVHYWLDRSVVRNTEPIEVQVHIPPPSDALVLHNGLQLLSVETELLRVTQSHPLGAMLSDTDVLEHTLALKRHMPRRQERGETSRTADAGGSGAAPSPLVRMVPVAYSGKSCRFHSVEAVHLRLALHPLSPRVPQPDAFDAHATQHSLGGDGRCESITQDTPLHSVRFVVCVRVVLRDGSGAQRDVCTAQLVKVLPAAVGDAAPVDGAPAAPPSPSSKHGKAPMPTEHNVAAWFIDVAEYDGYDDASRPDHAMLATAVTGGSGALGSDDNTMAFATTATQDPPPSMTDHVLDARLADDLGTNTSYASQLAQIPPPDESVAMYDSVMELVEEPAPSDEPPNFEQAAQQDAALLDFDASPPAAWPARPPRGMSLPTPLPPSYADAASAEHSTPTSPRDARPPAYFTAPPTVSGVDGTTAEHCVSANVFPPVYEA